MLITKTAKHHSKFQTNDAWFCYFMSIAVGVSPITAYVTLSY
mgnify:FL=1